MIRPSTLGAALVSGSLLFSSSYAGAQGAKEDLTNLERNLADETAALSTSDCATACRALASIRRAADRICALDAGERCAAGRAKADDATRRVRDACPECAIATAPPQPAPEREERAMGKGGSRKPAAEAPESTVQAASAPPSESRRGGCASCTTSGASPSDLAGTGLAMTVLALLLRRRGKRGERP